MIVSSPAASPEAEYLDPFNRVKVPGSVTAMSPEQVSFQSDSMETMAHTG